MNKLTNIKHFLPKNLVRIQQTFIQIQLLIKSHMSSPKELKRSLFALQASFSLKTNPKSPSQAQKDHSILTVLKENIHNQQKERLKNKYQRIIKAKQGQTIEMTKKYHIIEDQFKKFVKNHRIVTLQRDKLQEKLKEITNQHHEKESKLTQKYSVQIKSQEQSMERLKKQVKKLAQELASQQERLLNLSKEHKISMRRSTSKFQEARTHLSSQLLIKQKQQEKVEALFEQKKQDYNSIILEKDQQKNSLLKEIQTLKNQRDRLQSEMTSFQNQKMDDYRQFQKEVTAMEGIIEETKAANFQFICKIKESLQKFKNTLQLSSDDQDPVTLIQKMLQEIINRKDPKQYEETIRKSSAQIEALRQSEKDITNKYNILKDEISFMRNQNTINNDFAAIIKSHIKDLDEKINETDKTTSKSNPIKLRQNNPSPSKQVLQIKNSQDSQHIQSMPRSIQQLKPLKKVTESSIQNCIQKSAGKTSNDFLKEQLESKKKSLIYLMYRTSEGKQNTRTDTPSSNNPNASTLPARKRSNSLGNLVSAKCKEHLP